MSSSKRRKDKPPNRKRNTHKLSRGGSAYAQTYETAGTIWRTYETDLIPEVVTDLQDNVYVIIGDELQVWLGYASRLLMQHRPLRTQILFNGTVTDIRTNVSHPASFYSRVTPDALRQLPTGEEAKRRERAGEKGFRLDAHEEATAIYSALVTEFQSSGLSERAARGAARREIQSHLGYANARSVTNLLQPGGRRGVSEAIKANLSTWFEELGRPGVTKRPARGQGREIPSVQWIAEVQRLLEAQVRKWIEDYGEVEFHHTLLQGQDFKH